MPGKKPFLLLSFMVYTGTPPFSPRAPRVRRRKAQRAGRLKHTLLLSLSLSLALSVSLSLSLALSLFLSGASPAPRRDPFPRLTSYSHSSAAAVRRCSTGSVCAWYYYFALSKALVIKLLDPPKRLSFSFIFSHAHASHSHTHTLPHSHSPTLPLSHSPTLPLSHSLTLALSHSDTLTLTLTLSLSLSLLLHSGEAPPREGHGHSGPPVCLAVRWRPGGLIGHLWVGLGVSEASRQCALRSRAGESVHHPLCS